AGGGGAAAGVGCTGVGTGVRLVPVCPDCWTLSGPLASPSRWATRPPTGGASVVGADVDGGRGASYTTGIPGSGSWSSSTTDRIATVAQKAAPVCRANLRTLVDCHSARRRVRRDIR